MARHTTTTTTTGSTRTGHGIHPFHMVSNILIWISAVIVMGILSYLLHQNRDQGSHIVYEEVVAVLTVAFFLLAFFLARLRGMFMLFNLIFSYLWIVAVAFTASDFSHSHSKLLYTVEAFSFIAFFLLFFNVLFDWHYGYLGGSTRNTSHV